MTVHDVESASQATPEQRRAQFRVVQGEPTDVELAALTVVLAAAATAAPTTPATRDLWSDPAVALRGALHPGQAAWRTTYLHR